MAQPVCDPSHFPLLPLPLPFLLLLADSIGFWQVVGLKAPWLGCKQREHWCTSEGFLAQTPFGNVCEHWPFWNPSHRRFPERFVAMPLLFDCCAFLVFLIFVGLVGAGGELRDP